MKHVLKCHPEPFWASAEGRKLYEVRVNDRNYQVGDELVLRCWDPETEQFQGEWIEGRITYLTAGPDWGIPEGLVVLGFVEEVFDSGADEPYPGKQAQPAGAVQ